MNPPEPDDRRDAIQAAAQEFALATADSADPELFRPLTFLLAQVRRALDMDIAFVSRFSTSERVFEVVSAETRQAHEIQAGEKDLLLETYCHNIVEGRLPPLINDTSAIPAANALEVTDRLNIRAYLCAPVVLPNGRVFGTVCCICHKPRADLVEADLRALKAVAQAVAASIDRKGTVRFASWALPGSNAEEH